MPVLFYLAGLTCTEETFPIKAGASASLPNWAHKCWSRRIPARRAQCASEAELGLRRRGRLLPGCAAEPWARHWRMESFTSPASCGPLVGAHFPADLALAVASSGHSMGGHGALTLPCVTELYRSVSYRDCRPTLCPGVKRPLPAIWARTAATVADPRRQRADRGMGGAARRSWWTGPGRLFLPTQLNPGASNGCAAAGATPQPAPAGADHGYCAISTFAGGPPGPSRRAALASPAPGPALPVRRPPHLPGRAACQPGWV